MNATDPVPLVHPDGELKKALVALSFLSMVVFPVTGSGASQISDRPSINGLLLLYRSFIAREAVDDQRLHSRLQTRIGYRVQAIPLDVVLFMNSKMNGDGDQLLRLCDEYGKRPEIKKCELNEKLRWHTQEDEPICLSPTDSSLGVKKLERELTEVKAVLPCELVDSKALFARTGLAIPLVLGGELSPTWAQDAIGADLAEESFRQGVDVKAVSVAMIEDNAVRAHLPTERLSREFSIVSSSEEKESVPKESTKEYHGTAVAHLMVGPLGVSPVARLVSIHTGGYSDIYPRIVDDFKNRPASVLNISSTVGATEAVRVSLTRISQGNTAVVLAAGNSYPSAPDANTQLIQDAFVVSSLSPIGLVSGFAQENGSVKYFAPSDRHIQSISAAKGGIFSFGGTSGAAPLLSGSLANVKAILPNLTNKELHLLTENCGLKTAAGVLLINGYKMVRVAQRIQALEGWSSLPSEARLKVLQNKKTYDFSKEGSTMLSSANRLLKSNKKSGEVDCENEKEALKLLRISFLLSGNNKARALAQGLYEKAGLKYQALFLKSFGTSSDLRAVILAGLKDNDINVRASAIRSLPFLNTFFQKQAARTALSRIESRDRILVNAIVGTAGTLGFAKPIHDAFNAPDATPDLKFKALSSILRLPKFSESDTDLIFQGFMEFYKKRTSFFHRQLLTDALGLIQQLPPKKKGEIISNLSALILAYRIRPSRGLEKPFLQMCEALGPGVEPLIAQFTKSLSNG